MELPSGSSNRSRGRYPCRSLVGIKNAHSFSSCHRSRTPRKLYHGFLILILVLCLGPTATLARPAPAISDPSTDTSPSALQLNGEIIADDHYARSSLQLRGSPQPGGAVSRDARHTEESLLRRQAAGSSSSSQMPTPFDTMSINFANASCVSFYQNFLSNSTVMNCHAVSLLLENSNSFFHTLSSAAATSRVLDVACSQPVSECASIMKSVADEMLQSDNCGPDYQSGNSVVQGTYRDFMAYEPMYRATCLTNPDTQNYCFVDAVTNTTTPDDYNVYFMPLGSRLRAHHLTCNECLQATMNVYAQWATIDGQSLDTTYVPSARNVNSVCGAGFAKTNITVGSAQVTGGTGLTVPLPDIRIAASILGLVLGATLSGWF